MTDTVTCLLDTNVVSELMKQRPDSTVSEYLDVKLKREVIGLAVITVFEILNGIGRLPAGRRREAIAAGFEGVLTTLFDDRIVSWSLSDAAACAEIMERRRRTGEPLDDHFQDAMLAGTAYNRNLKIVTRNDGEFRNTGVTVLNPWRA